jgi:hypothetical protein
MERGESADALGTHRGQAFRLENLGGLAGFTPAHLPDDCSTATGVVVAGMLRAVRPVGDGLEGGDDGGGVFRAEEGVGMEQTAADGPGGLPGPLGRADLGHEEDKLGGSVVLDLSGSRGEVVSHVHSPVQRLEPG